MAKKLLTIFLLIFLISLATAIPTCSDTNEIDINEIPCVGFTIPINCSGNISVFNSTDASINYTLTTALFTSNVYNFTINLSQGGYEFLDCENNTATVIVGLFEQGYGISMFVIIFPSILLTMISLFVSGRLFHKFHDEDEEEYEYKARENDEDSFVPRNRLIPIVLMLFAFVPMVFMIGFVNGYLEEYLPSANITDFYGWFYVLFSTLFYFVCLISIIVWASSFIKMRRVMRGLDDIE